MGITKIEGEDHQDGFHYKWVRIDDNPNDRYVLLKALPGCINFIQRAIVEGNKVYVHCAAGVSRSASVVIAYLMVSHRIGYAEAFEMVRKKRFVEPNDGFVQALKELESRLRDEGPDYLAANSAKEVVKMGRRAKLRK